MTLVVDASVLVAALTKQGEHAGWAGSLMDVAEMSSPEIVLAEVAHAVRRLERTNAIATVDASQAFSELLKLRLELYPFRPYAKRIWALRANLTAYDAWYVALAEHLGIPLATLDRRLVRSTQAACDFLLPDAV